MKRTKEAKEIQDLANELIKSVSKLIERLGIVEDHVRELNSDERQYYSLLWLIYDFLAKSDLMNNNTDNYRIMDDDLIDLDNEELRNKKVYKYFYQSFKIVDEILAKIKINGENIN